MDKQGIWKTKVDVISNKTESEIDTKILSIV